MCFTIDPKKTKEGSKRRIAYKVVHDIPGGRDVFGYEISPPGLSSMHSYCYGKTAYKLGVEYRVPHKSGFVNQYTRSQSARGVYVYTTLKEAQRALSGTWSLDTVIIRVSVKPEDFLKAARYGHQATYRAVKPTSIVERQRK